MQMLHKTSVSFFWAVAQKSNFFTFQPKQSNTGQMCECMLTKRCMLTKSGSIFADTTKQFFS